MKNWIKRLLGIKEKEEFKIPTAIGILDLWVEKSKNEYRQKQENCRLKCKAKREAFQMYVQWDSRKLDALIWKDQYKGSILAMKYNPFQGLGMWVSMSPGIIHHYPNDKVQPITQEEYNKIRDEEFERLKLTSP